MKKTALFLMIITIISKISGFARDITLSYFYGVSNISDAYLISMTIPLTIFGFIGTSISTGFIPMYNKIEQAYGENEGNRYTNNLINVLIVISTVILILGLLFTSQIVNVFASGFKGETLKLTIEFTRISLIGIYFMGIISIFGGFLQLKNNYIIPASIGLPMNFLVILSILFSTYTSVLMLPIGTVIATASQLVLLLPFIHKKGYRYKLVFDLRDEHIRNMGIIVLPVIMGLSVNQINVLVDRTIASRVAIGGISALNYAVRLNGFVQSIFVLSIATVMFPMISKMAAESNMQGLKKSVSEAISSINLLLMPVTVGAMLFSEPVVRLLFGRGAFNSEAISMTSYALFFYSIGMVGFGIRQILTRAFYSLQDTKTPMINAAIAMVLNIVLNIILSKYLGIGGLALATSISAILVTILMFISLRKKIGPFGMKQISISFLKIFFASSLMGVLSKLLFNYLTTEILSENISLIISIGIGAIIYFTIIYFMKIEDVDVIVNAIKKKMKKSAP